LPSPENHYLTRALALLDSKTYANEPPILVFENGEELEVLLAAKQLQIGNRAECILIGDELAIWDKAQANRVNPELFFGILNPINSPHTEPFLATYQRLHPEEDRKTALACIRLPEVYAELLLSQGHADAIVK